MGVLQVSNKQALLRQTFLRTFVPIEGMPELYTVGNSVFLHELSSNSRQQLGMPLYDFPSLYRVFIAHVGSGVAKGHGSGVPLR